MSNTPIYKQITFFIQNYGNTGNPDQRNVADFMECETSEAVKSLQNELIGITHSNFIPEIMDKVIGISRRTKYNTYEEWAKFMLLWIAEYKG